MRAGLADKGGGRGDGVGEGDGVGGVGEVGEVGGDGELRTLHLARRCPYHKLT